MRSASRPKAAHGRHRHARTMPHMETPVFTTTRHAASLRSSNNCKCVIEIFFIARGESPLHKRLNLHGPFGRVPLLEYGGLQPILPFLEGRSDAACRIVIHLRRSRCCLRGVNGVEGGNPPNDLPAMPTVGAGSSQREDSPAHLPPVAIRANQTWGPTVYNDAVIFNRNAARHVATNAAAPPHRRRGPE